MASHAPNSLEALLPLTIRLQTLEAQILGVQSSYDAGPSTRRSGGGSESNFDVSRKLRGIQDGLERTGSQSEALKRLLNGLLGLISSALDVDESYKHLLSIPGSEAHTTLEDQGGDNKAGDDPVDHPVGPSDLLPDSAKIAILLEAKEDIVAAERDLREIETLKQRGVEGSGNLEALLPLKPEVTAQAQAAKQRTDAVADARAEVARLLWRHDDYTYTVSELFLHLQQRMEELEQTVEHMERAKRREIKQRY